LGWRVVDHIDHIDHGEERQRGMTMALRARLRTVIALGVTAAAAVAAAGCGGQTAASGSGAAGTARGGVTTITDCGHVRSTFTSPPKRVVTLTPSVLEMLFWLGVQHTVIGQGVPPAPGSFPPQFARAADAIKRLGGGYSAGAYRPVPKEQLLAAGPDFVVGGFASNFSTAGGASQRDLAATRINSYLSLSTDCSAALTAPQSDLTLVKRDITNLAAAFGIPARGRELTAGMDAKVRGVQGKLAGTTRPAVFPFEFDEGTKTPYAPGNRQTINGVINLAGGRNIFSDVDKAYEKVDWEQIVKRNPQVILIIVYAKPDAAATRADVARAEHFLTTDPALRGLAAVRQRRFASLVYEQGSVGSVRNADAVAALARQLHPDRFH
jgi:iron complex transport system substrate-binding protein